MNTTIGQRVWPIDWDARTSGRVVYTGDMVPPGALFGAILRSPHPHAEIISIDTSAAAHMPGVRAVITAANFRPGARYFHEVCLDRPPLADGVVRFVGQEVAAVAADTEAQAQAAAASICVRYRRLPANLTIHDALAPDAPQLHARAAQKPPPAADENKGGGHHPSPPAFADEPNIRRQIKTRFGDIEGARAGSTVTVSGVFWFPQQNHVCMETNRSLAHWIDGRLHMWASTASSRFLQHELAGVFGMPKEQIVIHEVGVGGSFGAKAAICEHEALSAMLARQTGQPVLIAYSREDDIGASKSRHGFEVEMTLHADRSGKLRMIEAQQRVDNGAYIHGGASVMMASLGLLRGVYKVDALKVDSNLIDTAKLPGGAFRGYGAPQACLPLECLMDDLARALGRDPLDLRRQNFLRSQGHDLVGTLGEVGLVDSLDAVRSAIGWDRERANRRRGRGVGVAAAQEVSGTHGMPGGNISGGQVGLSTEGDLEVRFGGCDAGTGQKTILAQIASHELGVPMERITVISMDTDKTPFDLGAFSSRGTHYTGHAIRQVSTEFAEKLKQLAGERLGEGEIRLEDGFARNTNGEQIGLGALVSISNEAIDGVLSHFSMFEDKNVEMMRPDGTGNMTATRNYGVHGAIVEVDEKTGAFEIMDYVAGNDSGTALNPTLLEGQVVGGVVQGLGAVQGEELIFEQGRVVNQGFMHYPAPRAADIPKIRPLLTPRPDALGPYGAKAVGEISIIPVGPAISNAIYDAIGVRIGALPITPDKIINALAQKAGRKRHYNIWRRPQRWYIELVRRMYPLGLLKLLHDYQLSKLKPQLPAPPAREVTAPKSAREIVAALTPEAAVLGGGSNLHLRRRRNVFAPEKLVAVANAADLKQLDFRPNAPIVIGAGVTLSDLAEAARSALPALYEAIQEIATPQIRNVATVAGNVLQDKCCWFFRNGFPCHKRTGEQLAPCYAVEGDHRFYHAVIDGHRCQAVTPSDLGHIFVALDAVATILGPDGASRQLKIEELYTGPGETALGARELITAITIPAAAAARQTAFKKLNLWQGDFAIVSSSISIATDAAGLCTEARLCLGAVAGKPWRARKTEAGLIGQRVTPELVRQLLDQELNAHAHPLARNEWKLDAAAGITERAVEALQPAS